MAEIWVIFGVIIGFIAIILLASAHMAWRQYIEEIMAITKDYDLINVRHLTLEESWPQPHGDCIDGKRVMLELEELDARSKGKVWVEPMSDLYSFGLHSHRPNVLFFRMRLDEDGNLTLVKKSVSLNGTKIRITLEIEETLDELGREEFTMWKLTQ